MIFPGLPAYDGELTTIGFSALARDVVEGLFVVERTNVSVHPDDLAIVNAGPGDHYAARVLSMTPMERRLPGPARVALLPIGTVNHWPGHGSD